jgi:beta-galactosidase
MRNPSINLLICTTAVLLAVSRPAPAADQRLKPAASPARRERLLMDFGWRFAFGHATDVGKDFNHATGAFSYLAKTGSTSGTGPAFDFDDSGWRKLDLPHDWAVEVPFDQRGSGSHGSKAIGRNFPENSVGWYRKSFNIPASDLGKRISIEFDGVFRDSIVWINGHYLGTEESGYSSFAHNLTEFLNYGGNNVIAVRVDASLEEGWFYEGAGIYRHVWLTKTDPLHVQRHGTFVTTDIKDNSANVTAHVTVLNEATNTSTFDVEQTILDADGKPIASGQVKEASLKAGDNGEFSSIIAVANPKLWSLETPYLHKLITTIKSGGTVVDRYETPFGIRSIRFDANQGFFLNGKHVKLHGTDNHQDHAGVGAAIPDALQEFRIAQLKNMGCNAYRTSHNPPTPEMLDACDRLGMLVLDENRLMGTAEVHLNNLKQLILRDRNHPSIMLWSIGNEEWTIEGSEQGTRIAATMQAFAQRLDPTRRFTVASSGNWGRGYSVSIDVMGYNYYTHGDSDRFHADFPDKPSVGTEEGSTFSTRGVYVQDREHQHLTAYDVNKPDWGALAERGWTHYADRAYLAGMFIWTGFDYRGEPTPFNWPAISSQFGVLDLCGFRKDNSYYYESWWSDKPVVHILPHWNWPGKEGQEIDVWCHSNCEEVELFLNGQSRGRKTMKKNSHLGWKVKYAPGTLLARGYQGGKEILTDKIETTGEPAKIQLTPHRAVLKADGEDVSVVTVQVNDAQGRMVPTAGNAITFEISGPGKIIGVGNGDPSSHEADKIVEKVSSVSIANWRRLTVDSTENRLEVAFDFNDADWQTAFGGRGGGGASSNQPTVYRGVFELAKADAQKFSLSLRSVGEQQSVYLNGKLLAQNVRRDNAGPEFDLDAATLRAGKNVIAIVTTASTSRRRDGQGGGGGSPGTIRVVTPVEAWKRSLFSGLAQVIVQSAQESGEISLTARSEGLSPVVLKLQVQPTPLRAVVAAR